MSEKFFDWMLADGRFCDNLAELLDSFCHFLNRRGFGIRRSTMALSTLNPQTEALRYVWYDEVIDPSPILAPSLFFRQIYHHQNSTIDETLLSFGSGDSPMYRASPFYRIDTEVTELHVKVNLPGKEQAYPLFDDLAELGCTDYYCTRFNSQKNERAQISLATDRIDGFEPSHINKLKKWLPFVSLLKDIHRQKLMTQTILDVYLGKHPGQQILTGSIKPGDVTRLDAAIWFSDLRQFTKMSQHVVPETLVLWLNEYFEILVEVIYSGGGEILKYIGDAVLAIFPVDSFGSMQKAVAAALESALQANLKLKELNSKRKKQHLALMNHGIGLHAGEVL